MNILKTAIFTACIVGIVSCFTDIAAPGSGLKKQLKIILTIILILGIFAPFLGDGFKLDFKDYDDLTKTEEYENLNEDFRDMYLNLTSDKIGETLEQLIRQKGIVIEKAVIESELNEYNSLETKKVNIIAQGLSEADKESIKKTVSENLPDAWVDFSEEDDSEH